MLLSGCSFSMKLIAGSSRENVSRRRSTRLAEREPASLTTLVFQSFSQCVQGSIRQPSVLWNFVDNRGAASSDRGVWLLCIQSCQGWFRTKVLGAIIGTRRRVLARAASYQLVLPNGTRLQYQTQPKTKGKAWAHDHPSNEWTNDLTSGSNPCSSWLDIAVNFYINNNL